MEMGQNESAFSIELEMSNNIKRKRRLQDLLASYNFYWYKLLIFGLAIIDKGKRDFLC